MAERNWVGVSLRLDPYIHGELKRIAELEQRSLHNLITVALRQFVARYNEQARGQQGR